MTSFVPYAATILEIGVGELLAVVVAHNKAGGLFLADQGGGLQRTLLSAIAMSALCQKRTFETKEAVN